MTREKAIKHLGYVRDNNIPISSDAFDALSMAISALEQPEPCEDAVSREALRKAMYHRVFETDGDTMWQSGCWVRYRAVEQVIKESPSVTPKQRWIPVSERLPEKPYGCLVTVWDTDPVTLDEFENILPYFVGWDGEQWNDADGEQCPFEVIAWMPLPEPFREEGDE